MPARFWERDAHCFAVKGLRVGAADDELQRFSEETRWLFEARSALKMPCQKHLCRLERLEATGGTNGGHAIDEDSR